MDGAFMCKIVKLVWTLVLVSVMFAVGVLLADKYTLGKQLIRIRVVAASDSAEDQKIKLQVRDAINAYLAENMPQVNNVKQAKLFLQEHIPQLSDAAKDTLRSVDCDMSVRVYLQREEASTRHYETFSLPSGVYDTLRVDIGKSQGENWWCVVFPTLCMPKTTAGFHEMAVSCGISENLTDTLAGNGYYQVRFFFIDCLGKLENLLHKS